MVLILKLILIILLNKTYALLTQDSEIVLLPAWNPTGAKEISLTLKIFGKLIQLNLHRNKQFVSPAFKIWKYNANGVTEKLSKLKTSDSCFYIHEDNVSFAAINICHKHGLEGLIFVENDTLEIRPLWNMFTSLLFIDDSCVRQQINQSFGTPHLVTKLQRHFAGSDLYNSYKTRSKRRFIDKEQKERYTIELAVFVDVTAYRRFMPLLNNNISDICNMMFTYVNQMQAFFHHPSLGILVDIVLIHLYIMQEQPPNLSTYEDDIRAQLYSFCNFATTLNHPNDNNPNHWDIALFVTGLDFYKTVRYEHIFTGKDYAISGESFPNGACKPKLSCAIVEFLRHEVEATGLRSSLNAIYQIGILLGLREVSNIGSDSYIMSSERPYHGEITWSPQSRDIIKWQLREKSCFQDHPEPKNVETEKSDYNNNSLCDTITGRK